MDNIGMKKDNFTYIKNTNKNEVKYKIFEHLKDEYADRILIFTKSFNYAIEFINFTNHVDKLIIDESNILYTALDTLLCDENILEIPNEDVRVEEDFKLIIKRTLFKYNILYICISYYYSSAIYISFFIFFLIIFKY